MSKSNRIKGKWDDLLGCRENNVLVKRVQRDKPVLQAPPAKRTKPTETERKPTKTERKLAKQDKFNKRELTQQSLRQKGHEKITNLLARYKYAQA